MAKAQFDKFINKPVKGAKLKEALRQEKKAAIRERRAAIEKHFEDKRKEKAERNSVQGSNENMQGSRGNKFKPANKPAAAPKKPMAKGKEPAPAPQRAAAKRPAPRPVSAKPEDAPRSNFKQRDDKPAYKPAPAAARPAKRNFEKPASDKPRPAVDRPKAAPVKVADQRTKPPFDKERSSRPTAADRKPTARPAADRRPAKPIEKKEAPLTPKAKYEKAAPAVEKPVTNEMPLNKFIAHAGICSRRDAADVVRRGVVTVNGVKITEPAYKVTDDAEVMVDGKKVRRSRNHVYILLNKPKDHLTTMEDPQGRKTVMDIIKNATTERVFPVGRLDRNTSGVLLLTNDGDLAQQLSHPSYEVRKIYEVKLDKVLQKDDFDRILKGIMLEDGEVHADSLAFADKDRTVVGIEIHSGRNRIVRRIFEHLGYDVRGLDRVMYANLTKKNVERGKWRFLTEKEVRLLKYFNKSKR